jgi:hypothetical protein
VTALERLDPRRSWPGFLAVAGLGLMALFISLDPAPSRELGTSAKVAFWALHIYLPLALAQGCQLVLTRHPLPFGRVWVSIAAAGIAASALFAPIALILDGLFSAANGRPRGEALRLAEVLEEWVRLAPPVALVWLGLNAVRFLRLSAGLPPPPEGTREFPTRPKFMDRLPASRRGPLVALSAELHYLRVYTTKGDTLILQGFGEALSELGPDTGLQIHRSHWIDPGFASEIIRKGSRTDVRLSNGLVLPVARSRRAEVAAILEGIGIHPRG